jgi:hypothetical protein
VGAFIAAGRSGSALGRQRRPTSERGQTSARVREHDVGLRTSPSAGVKAKWVGEGRSTARFSGRSSPARFLRSEVGPGKERGRFGLGLRGRERSQR